MQGLSARVRPPAMATAQESTLRRGNQQTNSTRTCERGSMKLPVEWCVPRPLPRRRVPATCFGGEPHYWMVDSIDIMLGAPDFFQRHQDAPQGWTWVLCLHCEFGYMVPIDRAPKLFRARFCERCWRVVPQVRNGRPRTYCEECADVLKRDNHRARQRAFKKRHPEKHRENERQRYQRRKEQAA